MKLKEMKCQEIYFEKEKDRISALYGDGSVAKGGFSTQGPSRSKILTKFEEVVRNKQIKVYSSRLYEEVKTFVWKGTKPQAMRGKHDDLVMSLAIGIWLYDTSNFHSKSSADINKAMLAGFSSESNVYAGSRGSSFGGEYLKNVLYTQRAVPYDKVSRYLSGSMDTDFKWLI